MALRLLTVLREIVPCLGRWRPDARLAASAFQKLIGNEPAHSGRVVSCCYDFVCGWVDDVDATSIAIMVNGSQFEIHGLSSTSKREFRKGHKRRYFLVPFKHRLRDGDMVAVCINDLHLAGSPTKIASAKSAARDKGPSTRLHVDFPDAPIANRLCTMAGWVQFEAGCCDIRFFVEGRSQRASFIERADAASYLRTPLVVGWQLTCDVVALKASGARAIRLSCEIDGHLIAERQLCVDLALVRPRQSPTVFMHIPKTAGTSLSVAIQNQPELNTYWLYTRGNVSIDEQLQQLSPASFANTDLVMGHFTFGIHRNLGDSCKYVTFLREPLSFIMSYFFYVKYVQNSSVFAGRDIYTSIADCLDLTLDNCFTRYFAGPSIDRVNETVFATAVTNMESHFGFVGLVERMDESVSRLASFLGTRLETRRENRTPLTAEAGAVDMQKLSEVAAPYISFDKRLYQHAVEMFWR